MGGQHRPTRRFAVVLPTTGASLGFAQLGRTRAVEVPSTRLAITSAEFAIAAPCRTRLFFQRAVTAARSGSWVNTRPRATSATAGRVVARVASVCRDSP